RIHRWKMHAACFGWFSGGAVFVCEWLLVKQKVVEQTNKALDLFYNLKRWLFGKKNISFTLQLLYLLEQLNSIY
ncbi:MAG: hypothetical protein ACJ75F_11540, partial [Flavisolibacter sp.]